MIIRLVTKICILCICFTYFSSVFAQNTENVIGKAMSLNGQVQIISPGETKFRSLKLHENIYVLDRVKTLKGSRLSILLIDGAIINLDEKTELVFPNRDFGQLKIGILKVKDTLSGINIGGYDPIVLNNEIVQILLDKKVLNKRKVDTVYSDLKINPRKVYSGNDVLRSTDLMIQLLLDADIISIEEADKAKKLAREDKSKVNKINGLNVIVLNSYIINLLVNKDIVTLEEGKSLIANSKAKKHTIKTPSAIVGIRG